MNNLELGFLSADNWQFLDKPTVGSSLLFIFSPQDINCECKQDKFYILHYFKLLTIHKSAFDIKNKNKNHHHSEISIGNGQKTNKKRYLSKKHECVGSWIRYLRNHKNTNDSLASGGRPL